jgi:hypothetical protein
MRLRDVHRVELKAPCGVGRPGVRAGAGHQRADDDDRAGRCDQGARQPDQFPAHEQFRRRVAFAAARPQQPGDRDHPDREGEVERDPARRELRAHRDAADHRLRHDPEEQRPRQPDQDRPARALAHCGDDRRRDGRGDGVGQQPVGELDDTVVAERGNRDQRSGGALRPGRAAEAGVGQPHRATGHHDERVRDQRAEAGQPHESGRGAAQQRDVSERAGT